MENMKILKLAIISIFFLVSEAKTQGRTTLAEKKSLARAAYGAGVNLRRAELAKKKRQEGAQPVASVEWLQSTYTNMTKNLFVLIFLGTKIDLSDEGEWEKWNYLWRDLPLDQDPYLSSSGRQKLFQEDWVIKATKESCSTTKKILELSSDELLIKLFNLMYGISTVASTLATPSVKDFDLFDQAANIYGLEQKGFNPELYEAIKNTKATHLIEQKSNFLQKYGLIFLSRISTLLKFSDDRFTKKVLELKEIETKINNFNLQQKKHAKIYKGFLYLPQDINHMRKIIIPLAQATNDLIAKAFQITAETVVNDVIATIKKGRLGQRPRALYEQPVIKNKKFIYKCEIAFNSPESSIDTQKILGLIQRQAIPMVKERINALRRSAISPLDDAGSKPMLQLLTTIRALF